MIEQRVNNGDDLKLTIFRSFTKWNIVWIILDIIALYFNDTVPLFLFLIILNMWVKYKTSCKFLECNKLFHIFTFIFFSVVEIILAHEFNNSGSNRLLTIIALFLSGLVQFLILLHDKKINNFYLSMHIVVDVGTLLLLCSLLFNLNNVRTIEEISLFNILSFIFVFALNYYLKNYLLTRRFNKQNGFNIKFKFWSTPHIKNNVVDREEYNQNIEYYSYFFGDMFCVVLLLSAAYATLNLNWCGKNILSNIIVMFVMTYIYMISNVLIFNLAKIPKEDLKSLLSFLFSVLSILAILIFLIFKDIGESKGNDIKIIFLSVLTWISPKIVPTVIDNIFIQLNYCKNKIIKLPEKFKANISIVNITIYCILLILNIMLEEISLKKINLANLNTVIIVVFISMMVGILCAILLITLFTYAFSEINSFYYKFEMKDSRLKKDSPVVVAKKAEPRRAQIIMILCANIISIFICIAYIIFINLFKDVEKQSAIEITKWSLPVVVPIFLKDLPIFLNYNEKKTKIKPTIKFDYFRKMIEINSLLTVIVFVVIRYFGICNLNNICSTILIILAIHGLSAVILLLLIPSLIEKQKRNCDCLKFSNSNVNHIK